jgi:acylphosphatase
VTTRGRVAAFCNRVEHVQDPTVRRRVVVTGLVQGVGFRVSVVRQAQSRNLAGWVRNRPDGSVEAVFEGPPEAVEPVVDWCRRGPRGAWVDHVEVYQEEPTGTEGFSISW